MMNRNVIIKASNLCRSFVNGNVTNHVLKNINLDIYEKDFTIIVGSSGSGKSTLLYSLSSMDRPTSGTILFEGQDISNYTDDELALLRSKKISYVFQSINLLNDLTTYENITYPGYLSLPKKVINQQTDQLLERFGLTDSKDKYPSELSGGQQQRIAIARAVVSNPKVIFADEPTGALNSASGKAVLDELTELNKDGQSIVMVTHDIKACARGNRLLYLNDGHIEGELNLGSYTPEDQPTREQKVFQFLESHNW